MLRSTSPGIKRLRPHGHASKPESSDAGQLCAEHGFYRQAVWAWDKVIRSNRRDYAAARARLEAYTMLINQQEAAGHSIARDAHKMHAAALQMLTRDFPGDPVAAEKLPWILYKTDAKDQCGAAASALPCARAAVAAAAAAVIGDPSLMSHHRYLCRCVLAMLLPTGTATSATCSSMAPPMQPRAASGSFVIPHLHLAGVPPRGNAPRTPRAGRSRSCRTSASATP
jgi:hypothetical protein